MAMNRHETSALEEFEQQAHNGYLSVQPGIFHSRLYTASGVDVMGILLQMYGRPNPQVKTGPVDTNCPLILCDLTQLDTPIVYASEAFSALTGYSSSEVLGYNCRFLQSSPSTRARPVSPNRAKEDKAALKEIRRAVGHNRECQVQITNYRKDGTQFLNYLTIIPVRWNSSDFNYSVGLQQGVA